MNGPADTDLDTAADKNADGSILGLLLAQQRDRWRRGERLFVEAILERQPALGGDDEAVLDLIYNEMVLREQVGDPPRLDEYLARFPRLAEPLRLQFELERGLGPECWSARTVRADGPRTLPTQEASFVGEVVAAAAPSRDGIPGYELLGLLGRGGMGVVYKARQVALNRVVALKMILAGDHSPPEARVRFLAEAEVVARLQHPHVVQVYHFGDHDGRPFFAMEYVAGGSLAQRLDGTPRPPREAAALVEALARALHEAHRQGVVHRDLKPANVLLDHDGTPKVADFGLAKVLAADSDLTRTGAIVGTPSYMAPEQAAGRASEVGPAADVYALGAILFELLTGRPPFRGTTVQETLEQVRCAEPVAPSRLVPSLPRDLGTIALKCLDKEPRRRYATAEALADDLRRFLDGRPVLARPVGRPERLWRWCRREPSVAGLLAGLVLAFAAGFAGVAWQWRRAEAEATVANKERARAEAEAVAANKERARAERNFGKARGVVERLTRLGQEMLGRPGLDKTGRAVLEEVLAFYQDSLQERGRDPAVRLETARAFMRVSGLRVDLGQRVRAAEDLRRSGELLDRLLAEFPAEADYRRERAQCYWRMGEFLKGDARWREAAEAFGRAVALEERLVAEFPDNPTYRAMLAAALANLASARRGDGALGEAETTYPRAIALQRAVLAAAPKNPVNRLDLALYLDGYGLVHWERGRRREAEDACREALGILRELVEDGPATAEQRYFLARTYRRAAIILAAPDRPGEAEQALRQALLLLERLVAEFPDNLTYRVMLAAALVNRADRHKSDGALDEAEATYLRAIALQRAVLAAAPEDPAYRLDLALSLDMYSQLHWERGRRPAARDACREALGILRELVEGGSATAERRFFLARVYNRSAIILAAPDRPGEAERARRQAVLLLERLVAEFPDITEYRPFLAHTANELAWALATGPDPQSRDPAEAVRLAAKAVEISPKDGNIWNTLGVAHYRNGDRPAAVAALEKAMQLRSGGDSFDWFFLAMIHARSGDPEQARRWYDKAIRWMEDGKSTNDQLRRFRAEAEALLGQSPARW